MFFWSFCMIFLLFLKILYYVPVYICSSIYMFFENFENNLKCSSIYMHIYTGSPLYCAMKITRGFLLRRKNTHLRSHRWIRENFEHSKSKCYWTFTLRPMILELGIKGTGPTHRQGKFELFSNTICVCLPC